MRRLRCLLPALLALAACRDAATPPRHAELPGDSVYQLGGPWRDQDGAAFPLASLRGQPVLLAMFFTHCPAVCPRLVGDLRAIEAALDGGSAVRFVLASFDHVRDQPPRLLEYARRHELGAERWTLLHGDAGSVRELAAVLGVAYERTPEGDFVHGNVIALLDADGRIAHRFAGLGTDPQAAAQRVRSLQAAR
jgi:protein SCO1/2